MTKERDQTCRFGMLQGLGILLGLFLVGLLLWSVPRMKQMMERARVPSEKERVAKLMQEDKGNLIKKDATEYEVYAGLIRLAQLKDPYARQEATQRIGSPSRVIREAVANALGYFDDESSVASLSKLLSDPEKSVRIQAIQGIGHLPGPAREKLIQEFLKGPISSIEERAAAYTSLIRVSTNPEIKSQALGKILQEVHKAKTDPEGMSVAMMALSTAPRDPRVLDMLRDILKREHSHPIWPLAIRHLASTQDAWLKKSIDTFAKSPDAQVRLAVVQTLHMICPVNRWALLEETLKKEKDLTVISAALSEPQYMPGKEAMALLQRMSEPTSSLKETEKTALKALLAEMKKSPAVDPCFAREVIQKK